MTDVVVRAFRKLKHLFKRKDIFIILIPVILAILILLSATAISASILNYHARYWSTLYPLLTTEELNRKLLVNASKEEDCVDIYCKKRFKYKMAAKDVDDMLSSITREIVVTFGEEGVVYRRYIISDRPRYFNIYTTFKNDQLESAHFVFDKCSEYVYLRTED